MQVPFKLKGVFGACGGLLFNCHDRGITVCWAYIGPLKAIVKLP